MSGPIRETSKPKPMPIAKMEPEEAKKYITPDNIGQKLKGKGRLDSVQTVLSHVGGVLSVRFHQIVHQLFTGEWVSNRTIWQSLEENITALENSKLDAAGIYTDEDEFEQSIARRTWIQNSIAQMRTLCDYMINKGVNEDLEPKTKDNETRELNKKISTITDLIKRLDSIDIKNTIGTQNEAMQYRKYQIADAGDARYPAVAYERYIIDKVEKGKIPSHKREEWARDVLRLINLAKKEKFQLENHYTSNESYLVVSLGQTWGSYSGDNKTLDYIETDARKGFPYKTEIKEISEEVNQLVALLKKGFTQEIKTKISAKNVMGYSDKLSIHIPAKADLPPHIQKEVDALLKSINEFK